MRILLRTIQLDQSVLKFLAVILFTAGISSALPSQIDASKVVGLYVTFVERPSSLKKSVSSFEYLNNTLQSTFNLQPLKESFPGARTPRLQRTMKLDVPSGQLPVGLVQFLEQDKTVEAFHIIYPAVVSEGPSDGVEYKNLEPLEASQGADSPDCPVPFTYNDPGTLSTEHVENMQLPCAWSITQGSPNITIGIVDNYFYPDHPDLVGKVVNVYNGSIPDPDTRNHGTAVAGGAGGIVNNGLCVAGAGFNSKLNLYGRGSALDGLWEAYRESNRVINMSISSRTWDSQLARDVATEIVDGGSVITFAVNGSNGTPFVDIDGVLMVGMGFESGAYRPYNYGTDDIGMDIILPIRDSYRLQSPDNLCAEGQANTSMAAPHLAGVIALMLDVNPCLRPHQIESIIKSTSNSISNSNDSRWSHLLEGVGRLNAYQAVLAAQQFDPDDVGELTINYGQSVTLSNERRDYSRVRVRTGGVLTVRGSTIGITESGRVLVERGAKLIIDNSKITLAGSGNFASCNYSEKTWKGISVAGNYNRQQPNMYRSDGSLNTNKYIAAQDAGVVMVINGSTISKARDAITTTVPGVPYSTQVDSWGGLVIAENSTFRNNRRAVEFMQYPNPSGNHSFSNRSRFINTTFVNDNTTAHRSGSGITIWDTDDILIKDCTFENLRRVNIQMINGGTSIHSGNLFIADNRISESLISSEATHPFSTHLRIGTMGEDKNRFTSASSYIDYIYCTSSNGDGGVKIINNEFSQEYSNYQSFDPIDIRGGTDFDISYNDFYLGYPAIYLSNTSTGDYSGFKLIKCNLFRNYGIGIQASGNNDGVRLLNNEFNSAMAYRDVSISGTIYKRQGHYYSPADNCFNRNNNSKSIYLSSNSTPIYYYYSYRGEPCYTPRVTGNVNPRSSYYLSSGCVEQKSIDYAKSSNISQDIDEQDILMLIKELKVKKANLPQTDTPKNMSRKLVEIEQLKNIISTELQKLTVSVRTKKGYERVKNTLLSVEEEELYVRVYGLAIDKGYYQEANRVLRRMSHLKSPRVDSFVNIQQINVDFLTSIQKRVQYKLNSKNYSYLYMCAQSPSKNGYLAAALLKLLTGQEVKHKRPTITKNHSSKPEQKVYDNNGDLGPSSPITVFPNPTSGSLSYSIDLPESSKVSSVAILDMYNRRMMDLGSASSSSSVDVSRLSPGIYLLRASTSSGVYTLQITIN